MSFLVFSRLNVVANILEPWPVYLDWSDPDDLSPWSKVWIQHQETTNISNSWINYLKIPFCNFTKFFIRILQYEIITSNSALRSSIVLCSKRFRSLSDSSFDLWALSSTESRVMEDLEFEEKKIYVLWRWFFLSICKKNTNTNKVKKGDFWTFSLWALTSRYSGGCSDQAQTLYWYADPHWTEVYGWPHPHSYLHFDWLLIKEKILEKNFQWFFKIFP